MRVFLLVTAQHTGTEIASRVLESCQDVNLAANVGVGVPNENWGRQVIDYVVGRSQDLDIFPRAQHSSHPEGAKWWTRNDLPVPGKAAPPLLVIHPFPGWHWEGDSHYHRLFTESKNLRKSVSIASCLRDPLAAIASSLVRTSEGAYRASLILETYATILRSDLPIVFFHTGDTLGDRRREIVLKFLSDMRATPSPITHALIEKWPVVHTADEVKFVVTNSVKHDPEHEEHLPVYRAARDLYKTGELSPPLRPWAEKLRQMGFQELLQRAGYTRQLPWFE